MGIVLTNGKCYIFLNKAGGVEKTPHLSKAHVFSNVNHAMERLWKAPAKTRGYYPMETEMVVPPKRQQRDYIPREVKDLVYTRAGGRCALCGRLLLPKEGTVDHIKPWINGGSDELDNLQLACYDCNQLKGKFEECDFFATVSKVFLHQMEAKSRVRGKICRMLAKGMI